MIFDIWHSNSFTCHHWCLSFSYGLLLVFFSLSLNNNRLTWFFSNWMFAKPKKKIENFHHYFTEKKVNCFFYAGFLHKRYCGLVINSKKKKLLKDNGEMLDLFDLHLVWKVFFSLPPFRKRKKNISSLFVVSMWWIMIIREYFCSCFYIFFFVSLWIFYSFISFQKKKKNQKESCMNE